MTKFALFVRLEAKPGQEAALAAFLAGALPLANAELGTTAWFALQFVLRRLAFPTPCRRGRPSSPPARPHRGGVDGQRSHLAQHPAQH